MKRDGDDPNPDEADEPNKGADELLPNAEFDPKEGDEFDPKEPDEDETPKGEELNVAEELPKPPENVEGFGANGFVDVDGAKGLEVD